jgi:hypothetical protein
MPFNGSTGSCHHILNGFKMASPEDLLKTETSFSASQRERLPVNRHFFNRHFKTTLGVQHVLAIVRSTVQQFRAGMVG